jgi:hypothetical protein
LEGCPAFFAFGDRAAKGVFPLFSESVASISRRRENPKKLAVSRGRGWRHVLFGLLVTALCGSSAYGQPEVPVVTGSAGFIYTKDAGQSVMQPILWPLVLVPIGSHFLVESSFEFQGFVARSSPNGPFEWNFFKSINYLQLDYIVNSHITIVAGRFDTPFNIYNERLGPMWITNFQDGPIIYPIGTRTSAASNGGMVRGVVTSRPSWLWNYTMFFSASSNSTYFSAGRAFGARTGVFFPKARFEIGTSYERFLQDQHFDSYGAYISWQPPAVPLDIKGEYAHSPEGHGYWIEGGYRFRETGRFGAFLKNVQPLVRGQQFFRLAPGTQDELPAANTQRVDFGINYYLPHTVRVNASYGRQFSSLGNSNNWAVDITYRFLFPMPFWPQGSN